MEVKCQWCHICAKEDLENIIPDHLEQLLPEGHFHFICSYTPLERGFTASLKLQLGTREEAETWLEDFQRSSRVILRVGKTYPTTNDTVRRNSYRVDMRCQHNTRQQVCAKRNTNCPAGLYLVVKKNRQSHNRKSRSSDSHIQEGLLLHVTIKHHHNHHLAYAATLQQQDVAKETVEKLEKLFQSGHSPSSALNTLKYDLQEERGGSYEYASADRSIWPDIHFCNRLYYSIFKREYGAASGDAMIEKLQERLEVYNKEQCETCARMESTADGQTVIALCTPVMKRIHRLERHSGDMLFVDSSGKCDRMSSRIFLLLTHSAAGGLPLGVIITTSESQSTIAAGLKLLQSLLPEEAFYGRRELGPKVVMTDGCKALRQALQNVFPQTTPLLSVFHVLQAMWRWLWDSHHGVPKGDRQWLLDIFKKLVYAMSPEELEASFHQVLQDPVVLRHQLYRDHLTAVFAQRRDWAICLCTGLLTRGSNTNKFAESAMRVLKDSIFHKLKVYNVTQLVDFICTRLEPYYIRRLLNVSTVKQEFKFNSVSPDRIVKEDESNYSISSEEGGVYLVNISMGMCTCPAGSNGALCKHQHSVMQAFRLQEGCHLPVTSFTAKISFYEMATGKFDVPETWFMGLQFEREKDCPTVPLNQSTQEEAGTTTPPTPQDDSGGEGASSQDAYSERLEDRLRSMFDGLMDKLKRDETFRAPVESLVSSYEKICTDSDLISALSTFGGMRSATARNIKRQPRNGLQVSTQTGVQPTAVARHKTPLGDRQELITGRPPKRARREHNYGNVKEGSGPLPRRPAPHSLAQCLSAGVSLGVQHSKK